MPATQLNTHGPAATVHSTDGAHAMGCTSPELWDRQSDNPQLCWQWPGPNMVRKGILYHFASDKTLCLFPPTAGWKRPHLMSMEGDLEFTLVTARQFCYQAANLWSQAVHVRSCDEAHPELSNQHHPHNANLHLWGKKPSPTCQLCPERQILQHILNHCTTAVEKRRYNKRHDEIITDDFCRNPKRLIEFHVG